MRQPSVAALPKRDREVRWLAYTRKQSRKKAQGVSRAPAPHPKPRQAPKATKIGFTSCLLSYAKASIDPFDQSISEACIPDNNAMPSHKFSTYINAQAVVGTQGVCLIGLNPWTMTAKDFGASPTHEDRPLLVTTAAYSSVSVDFAASLVGTQLEAYNSNSFYAVANIANQAMRLVGAAVEIFYTGPTLTQAGAVTVQQTPGLQYIPAGTTVSQIRNDPRSRTCSVSKGSRCYIAYQPIADDLLSYKLNSTYMPSQTPSIASVQGCYTPLVIVVAGAAPGTTFQVKAIAHFEALYPGMGVTPSHADPIGFPSFLSARSQIRQSDEPTEDLMATLKVTAKTIASNLSPYLPMAGAALGSLAGNAALGAQAGSVVKSALDVILDGKPFPI